jgi:peptidoglycan/LPS O-acetylase OafA/YrhL
LRPEAVRRCLAEHERSSRKWRRLLACYDLFEAMHLPKHIPQLDVLRGIAVLVVMLYHASDIVPSLHAGKIVALGYTGVDLFFVLSGFLITGILVRSKDQPNYFKNFYARRALRIWPIYYLLLLLTFGLLPIAAPTLRNAIFERSHPWQSFPFFAQNLMANGQGAFDTVRVTWSLAIEEQFYLAWPVIVWLAPRRILKPLALSAVLISIFVRWSVLYGLIPPVNIYTNTATRLDGLGLGAFLALWIPETKSSTVKRCGLAGSVLALSVGGMAGCFKPSHWAFYTAISVFFAGLLCVAINLPALSNIRFLTYTGTISYGLYLVHVPVFQLGAAARKFLPAQPAIALDIAVLAASLCLCYGLAAASWKFFESRILRAKSRFEYSYNTVALPSVSTGSAID